MSNPRWWDRLVDHLLMELNNWARKDCYTWTEEQKRQVQLLYERTHNASSRHDTQQPPDLDSVDT